MAEIEKTALTLSRLTWILVVGNLSVPAFIVLQRGANDLTDTQNTWAGWIAAALMTASVMAGAYLRLPADRRRLSRNMVWISLALFILSGFITTFSIMASPGDYLSIALSDKPLAKISSARKRLIVELIRRNKAASDENSRTARSMKPISPALYSVESFANRGAMESTSSQLKHAYEMDQSYAAATREARQDFRGKMQTVDPDYLRNFDSGMQKDDSQNASLEIEEAKWIESALALYDYAIAHASNISVTSSGKLVIAIDEQRESFFQQLEASKALQQAMFNDRAKFVKAQNALQDTLGMKHSE